MDNFRVIYKILKRLEAAMDFLEFDGDTVSENALGISTERRTALLSMMLKNGYIEGIIVKKYADGEEVILREENMKITLKGLEYLHDNSMMKKAARIAKGIAETIK